MTRVAIIAAMPGELKPSSATGRIPPAAPIRFWAQQHRRRRSGSRPAPARASTPLPAPFAGIEDGGPIDLVISIGWAGALTSDLAAGGAHNCAGVIDAPDRRAFQLRTAGAGLNCGLPPAPASPTSLRSTASPLPTKTALVDMEAAAIARLAAMRSIPFYAIKGVSDPLDAKRPDFNRFLASHGQFQTPQFVLFALLRPSRYGLLSSEWAKIVERLPKALRSGSTNS